MLGIRENVVNSWLVIYFSFFITFPLLLIYQDWNTWLLTCCVYRQKVISPCLFIIIYITSALPLQLPHALGRTQLPDITFVVNSTVFCNLSCKQLHINLNFTNIFSTLLFQSLFWIRCSSNQKPDRSFMRIQLGKVDIPSSWTWMSWQFWLFKNCSFFQVGMIV